MKTLYKLKEQTKHHDDFLVFDTETIVYKNNKKYWGFNAQPDGFLFGVLYGINFHKVINSVEDFISEFNKPEYKNKLVFAHNLEYDLNTLYGNVYKLDPEAIFNNKLISCSNGNVRFADSMNLIHGSVEYIGEKMGLLKGLELKENMNKEILFPLHYKFVEYCIQDCRIIFDALSQLFELAGGKKITIASLSLHYYRTYFQPYNITYDDILVKYFFNSYYGGRTEVFYLGETYATGKDVNSMYPDAMKECIFPNPKHLKKINNITVNQFITYYLKYFEGCGYMDIFHKEHYYGFLPVKHKKRLIFPVGIFSGWFNFNEIRFALEHDIIEIKRVHIIVFAPPMESIFKDYVDVNYEKRKQYKGGVNSLYDWLYKWLLTNLYGKFGQRIKERSVYIENINYEYDKIIEHKNKKTFIGLQLFNRIRLDCFLKVKTKKIDITHSIPSFPSYITSFARIKLLKYMLEHIDKKPAYCDTDSFFSRIAIDKSNSKTLGEWSDEDKIITYIGGLKNYRYIIGDKTGRKIKGVPNSAVEISTNTFEYTSVTKTLESLRRNIKPGQPIKRIKKLTLKYTKRIVLENGETKPIKL